VNGLSRAWVVWVFALIPALSPTPAATEDADAPTAIAQAAKPSGVISGVVREGTSGQPVAGAIVSLTPPRQSQQPQPFRQVTDEKGRFLFANLPASDGYLLSASKPGYLTGYHGRVAGNNSGTRIRLADGEAVSRADIVVWPLSSISGRVAAGDDALAGVVVRVLPVVSISGTKHVAAGVVAKTDDLGRYHIGSLPRGEYLVQVPYVDGLSPFPHAPVFFASAHRTEQAQPIALAHGQERRNVDFQLEPAPAYDIVGHIEGDASVLSGMKLRLLAPGTQGLSEGELASALVSASGTFAFKRVPAGNYLIDGRPVVGQIEVGALTSASTSVLPPAPQLGSTYSSLRIAAAPPGTSVTMRGRQTGTDFWIQESVTVDQNLRDFLLRARRAVRVSGHQMWDDGLSFGAGGHPAAVQLRLEPANGDPWLGVPRATAREEFAFGGVMAGQYVVRLIGNARIKSIVWNGGDYTHRPIDTTGERDLSGITITLTTATTVVAGTVRGDRAGSNVEAAVFIFPVEADQRTGYGYSPVRLVAPQVDSAGSFRVSSLPPGEYYAVAVPPDQADRWTDSSFLARAAAAGSRVSVKWGSAVTLDLKVSVVK
jgi:hypothetical protein